MTINVVISIGIIFYHFQNAEVYPSVYVKYDFVHMHKFAGMHNKNDAVFASQTYYVFPLQIVLSLLFKIFYSFLMMTFYLRVLTMHTNFIFF